MRHGKKERIVTFLAHRGLAFIKGFPPESETGALLVWTGGCNALVARWQGGKLLQWDDIEPIDVEEIFCWMRLPHPSIWPMIECQTTCAGARFICSENRCSHRIRIEMIRLLLALILLPFSSIACDMEVAFSPDRGATNLVVRTIESARHTVRVAAYSFTSRPIAEALLLTPAMA